MPAFTRYTCPRLCRRRLVWEVIFNVRVPCQGTMAARREAPSRGGADPLWKYIWFHFFFFCYYFLSDTKYDVKPSRLQRYLDILVRFEHRLVPGPGRQAPETSRCHPSLDDWSGVVPMPRR